MRRLSRQDDLPAGLKHYRHGKDKWTPTCPTQEERTGIWESLELMQGQRCAYCEGPIGPQNRHIEHFRQRDRHPQGTYDWNNLFGSCNRASTCGKSKDQCEIYPPEVLIKPDIEDPDVFLVFTPIGTVEPRADLSAQDSHRARETIRILGLGGALNEIRRAELIGYLQTLEYFVEIAELFPEEEWMPELQQEVSNVANLPYSTAIRHVLTRQSE